MTRHLPWVLLLFAFLACAERSRLAPIVTAPAAPSPSDVSNSLVVPYPPPPGKVETVPPSPLDQACVYLDGQWTFAARDWQWTSGTWVIAQPGCAFARPRLFWQTAGADHSELRFRPGHWVKADNPTLDCPAATACPGSTAASSL